jgi:hypothetical protein
MMCHDFLSAEELCNENPVVVVDTRDINEESAPVSAARLSIMTLFYCEGV